MDIQKNTKLTLRQWLLAKGMSVEKFSTETGIPEDKIYRIWNGNNRPRYDRIKIIREYTDGLVDW